MMTLKGFAIGVLVTFSALLLWGGVVQINEDPYGGGLILGAPMAILGGGLGVVSVRLLVDHLKK